MKVVEIVISRYFFFYFFFLFSHYLTETMFNDSFLFSNNILTGIIFLL